MARFTGNSGVVPTTASPFVSGTLNADLSDRIAGVVFSDTAGTLHVEQSVDGNNWDLDTTVAVAANVGSPVSVELVAPFYRVRYVPTTNPAVFRLAVRTSSAGSR